MIAAMLDPLTAPAPDGWSEDLVHAAMLADSFHITKLIDEVERAGCATSEDMRQELLISMAAMSLNRILRPQVPKDPSQKG